MGLPLILGGASGAAGLAHSFLTNDAMESALNAELGRQQGYAGQGQQAVNESLRGATEPVAREQIAMGTERAKKSYKDVQSLERTAAPSKGVAIGSGAPTNTAWADLAGAMRAPQQGYSEFTLQQAIRNLRTAQQLARINQQAQVEASTLGPRLSSAQHQYDWLGLGGNLLRGAGNVASMM